MVDPWQLDLALITRRDNLKFYETFHNPGRKIMKHFKILVGLDSLQVKWYIKSNTKNVVYELPHKLLNALRLENRYSNPKGKNTNAKGKGNLGTAQKMKFSIKYFF